MVNYQYPRLDSTTNAARLVRLASIGRAVPVAGVLLPMQGALGWGRPGLLARLDTGGRSTLSAGLWSAARRSAAVGHADVRFS